jgi:late competence protein required for DNA uptake (superfamily II DNA/RNA helicase)
MHTHIIKIPKQIWTNSAKDKKKKKKTLSHALNNWTEKGNSVHQPLYKTVAKIVSTDRHFEWWYEYA